MTETPETTAVTEPATLRFHYIKANSFRVIHVDGALGGPTPHGLLHMAIFNERLPIPLQTVHELRTSGPLGEPTSQVVRDGVVREVEADLLLTKDCARALIGWLQDALAKLDEIESKRVGQ